MHPPSCDSKRGACYRGAVARQDGYVLPTRMAIPMEPGKEESGQRGPVLLQGALDIQKQAGHGAEKLCRYLDSTVSVWPGLGAVGKAGSRAELEVNGSSSNWQAQQGEA